jgi:hypothetical protein
MRSPARDLLAHAKIYISIVRILSVFICRALPRANALVAAAIFCFGGISRARIYSLRCFT